MEYENVSQAIFIDRPSRFIAKVELNGVVVDAHIKNTGRCKEILVPGACVHVALAKNPDRATKYDLICVTKEDRLINIDSQAPNRVFFEYLQSGQFIDGITHIKPEFKHGASRFDFYVEARERKVLIEVKGVTLEKDGIASFPDAPTDRGIKHLNHLANSIKDGFEAHVVFIIKMQDITHFEPNNAIQPEFAQAVKNTQTQGVKIHAYDCLVTPTTLNINKPVKVIMQNNPPRPAPPSARK